MEESNVSVFFLTQNYILEKIETPRLYLSPTKMLKNE